MKNSKIFVYAFSFDYVEGNHEASFSTPIQKHIPFAYAFFIDCYFDNKLNEFYWYVMENESENILKMFVEQLMEKIKIFYENHIHNPQFTELSISKQEREFIIKSQINQPCVICNAPLDKNNYEDIVIDHCHLTNKINGLAHNTCNLQYKLKNEVNVFFHNLSRYDIHLFLNELYNYEDCSKLHIISKTSETYLSLHKTITLSDGSTIVVNFKDSLRFLSESLEALANNLLASEFVNTKDERWKLFTNKTVDENMLRKRLLPYNFIQNLESLNFPGLPPYISDYTNNSELVKQIFYKIQVIFK